MQNLAEKLIEWLTLYGLKALAAIAIFIFGRWIAIILRNLLKSMMKKSHLEDTLISDFLAPMILVIVPKFDFLKIFPCKID